MHINISKIIGEAREAFTFSHFTYNLKNILSTIISIYTSKSQFWKSKTIFYWWWYL